MVAASSLLRSQQPKVSTILLRSALFNRSSILSRRRTHVVLDVAPPSSSSSLLPHHHNASRSIATSSWPSSWPSTWSSTRPSTRPSTPSKTSIHGSTHEQRCQQRSYASSHFLFSKGDTSSDSSEFHSLYHDQMKEIESEREAIFGVSEDTSMDSPDLSQTAKAYLSPEENAGGFAQRQLAHHEHQQPSPTTTTTSTSTTTLPPPSPPSNNLTPPDWNAETANAEREELYEFSEEEKIAWGDTSSGTETVSHIRRIRQLRKAAAAQHHNAGSRGSAAAEMETSSQPNKSSSSPFSHLTPQGDGVSMVDVGYKSISRRVAVARSTVVFPPEVLSAFQLKGNSGDGQSQDQNRDGNSATEMIGPKGPIFETAKIAGIMGAKKTSDLIPLCHPLPLDRVDITIRLVNNTAVIECECTVTHKTGVEMEALTGASIAALTIYDMVKAVSHEVEIGSTVLVGKSGGKSDYVRDDVDVGGGR